MLKGKFYPPKWLLIATLIISFFSIIFHLFPYYFTKLLFGGQGGSGLYGMYRLADAQNSMATLMGVSLVFSIIAWIILITSGIIRARVKRRMK